MSGIALISGVQLRTRRDFDSLGPRLGLRYPRGPAAAGSLVPFASFFS